MKEILNKFDIAYQDSAKYYTECPNCTDKRKKKGARTLLVSNDGRYVRFKCLHEGQCDWNETQYYRLDGKEVEGIPQGNNFVAIPDDIDLPLPEGTSYHKYYNRKGELVTLNVRVEATAEKKKYFYPLSMTSNLDFVKEWAEPKQLYRSEKLDPKKERVVLIVEGEKTADAAAAMFTKADVISWRGGSNGVSHGDWELLNDRVVYLWPDADEPGVKAMEQIASLLKAKSIYIVDVSSLEQGADLADITKEQAGELFKTATKLDTDQVDKYTLADFKSDVQNYEPGIELLLGAQTKFRFPSRGLVVILGRTSHGKSLFMQNIANWVIEQTEKKVVYLSYEFPKNETMLRMIKIASGVRYSSDIEEDNQAYFDLITNNNLEGCDRIIEAVDTGRFRINDLQYRADQLAEIIDKPAYDNSVLILDYLQIIPIKGMDSQRYRELQKMCNDLREIANRRKILIITGSQVTDGESPYQDRTREAKDIEQAAEMMIKIWNKSHAAEGKFVKIKKDPDTKEEIEVPYYDEVAGDIVMHVTKYRTGIAGFKLGYVKKGSLTMEPVCGRIKKNEEDF
tara:strand:- start:6438 stop:8138 length:1701 start_codon:yes stop_codon:yes gene_type:complete